MRFEIVGKNISVTEGMRTKIEEKLSFLDKYILIDPNVIARVVCRVYPNTQKIEVTIPTKVGILRAEVEHEDFYAAIDLAIDKLEDQIRRQKTRLSRRHKDSLAESFIEKDEKVLEEEDIAVKTKTITPEKMDLEEAIMRMEMLGHSFFIYVDNEDDEIAVVYRRNDGKYGLIETER
ncbi:MAG: ribosome-associated translation inhibitor RaiA [Firmicutes bacterium]|nr:ribosome-associated translation inhibitor RaiA [Erysipelotrichaceae bacterium]MDD6524717.1 ribosome-associated translation inhibitor RaiA [Bacillota bacterium]MDY4973173.1 ribosome-associated translation inhibitor RaiA [Erysipelotrichaceae bacterium]MDY5997787.1 ribosome-associated translation inhibitor RaiA [Erysipelotrichaceae bacterium]